MIKECWVVTSDEYFTLVETSFLAAQMALEKLTNSNIVDVLENTTHTRAIVFVTSKDSERTELFQFQLYTFADAPVLTYTKDQDGHAKYCLK